VSRLTAEPNAGLFCAHAAIREQTARLLGAYAAWMAVNTNVNVPAVLSVLLHGLQVLWMDFPSLTVLFGVRWECVQPGGRLQGVYTGTPGAVYWAHMGPLVGWAKSQRAWHHHRPWW
jgi:hypothetical protein